MLLTLGLDSMFGNIEGVLTPLNDIGLTRNIRNEFVVGKCTISSRQYGEDNFLGGDSENLPQKGQRSSITEQKVFVEDVT